MNKNSASTGLIWKWEEKEGSALYPERFQGQQSQTHSLHSCTLHIHVGQKQTLSLMRPAADMGIIF